MTTQLTVVSRITALALTLAVLPGLTAAQSPPAVGVRVEFLASRYRLAFGTRLELVQTAVADSFAARLKDQIGFVRFRARDPSIEHQLVFLLDQSNRGTNDPFPEYGFWARLEKAGTQVTELYWLPLRPRELSSRGVGTEQEFLGELATKLAHADLRLVRESLLSRVPITKQVLPWSDPPGWALSLGSDSLCMKTSSVLQISSQLRRNGMTLDREDTARVVSIDFRISGATTPSPDHAPFLHKLFSEPTTPNRKAELLTEVRGRNVVVKEVFVLNYQRDPGCRRRPLDPATANPGGAQ
ncbi:MAG: hypothetical protein WEE89_00270 [Gemmatimonadota bacterium]